MRKHILIAGTFLLCILSAYSQKIVEYPRLSPKVGNVEGIQSPSVSLNGSWNFQTASIPITRIEVPGEWTMQGFTVPEGETAYYSRKFLLPFDWMGKRVKIRFDAVSSYGLVKVNGQAVGEHEGGMVPFELDITKAVKSGENEIVVEVRAWTISDRLGCISQYACHTVGGLVRKVTLFALPEINIAGMDVITQLDKGYKHADLHITTQVAREGNLSGTVTLNYILNDASGKAVANGKQNVDEKGVAESKLSVRNAKLWNSEEPYLYTLSTSLLVDGKVIQTNEQRVGLRQVEVKDNILYVNGKSVKLRGVNRHEAHPLRGRSLNPELCRQDAELFKAGNCNYIRTSHYPPSEELLDACDELGLFVESEAALNWMQHHASRIWQKWDYQDEQYLPYMMRANMDNILAGRRHPSVIIWSIANESRWSPLWEKVKNMVKVLDPSRPNSFHDQCWGSFNNAGNTADIANYHYPGINGPAACDTMSRPTLFGEYAHLSCYNSRELATDPGVRAAWSKPLVEMYDSMYYHPGCLGGALWSGIDDIFHLSDGRIVGYGSWGPIDGWRRPKPEYTGMKKAYTPFRILSYNRTSKQLELTVENRFNFIDFSKVTIEYGVKDGTMRPVKSSLPARAKGKVILPLQGLDEQDIYLRVTDGKGFVCHEELFTVERNITEEGEKTILKIEDKNDALHIVSTKPSGNHTIIFNKITGVIQQAYSGSDVLLQQGPVFSLVPMNSEDGGKPNVAGETYQNNMYPLKNYPHYTLFANNFNYKQETNGEIRVDIDATYWNGDTGKLTYLFGTDGKIKVNYEIKVAAKETKPRQYGLLMLLPKTLDNLAWKRKGEFSVYPEYDIARIDGQAKLNAKKLYEVEAWREVPRGAWKDDANILGSVDFRTTKTNILKASLTDNKGKGVIVYGNGMQASRSWLQDESIHFLIADYSNTGSERFYGTPFTSGRITVEKDDILHGELTFELK